MASRSPGLASPAQAVLLLRAHGALSRGHILTLPAGTVELLCASSLSTREALVCVTLTGDSRPATRGWGGAERAGETDGRTTGSGDLLGGQGLV